MDDLTFDLPPAMVDVEIACPYVNNMVVTTLISGHSEGEADPRIATIERLMDLWAANPAMPVGGTGGGDK